jgi:protein ImuB
MWFACLRVPDEVVPVADTAAVLLALGRESSPRVEGLGPRAVLLDASGLTRLFGGPRAFGEHLLQAAASRGLAVNVALAATRTAALLMAAGRGGVTVVPAGREAAVLAALPVGVLRALEPAGVGTGASRADVPSRRRKAASPARHYRVAPPPVRSSRAAPGTALPAPLFDTLERWGLRTLGDLAALPPADLSERLGADGARLRRRARGEDDRPLVRTPEDERFEQAIELDWPIEGLEPLSFVLARLLDRLCTHLERRDRGAAGLHLWLTLVTRAVHHRFLDLPAPMRDPRGLRTLLLLDLESHPPGAGVDRVVVAVEPAPARVVQFSLLARPLPSPDQLSTLTARLTALMGEGRCGSPRILDSHRPGAFATTPFAPVEERPPAGGGAHHQDAGTQAPMAVLRRFRQPLPARVVVDAGRLVRVVPRRAGVAGGHVQAASGPWRTAGAWWTAPGVGEGAWDRDEWDVALGDRAVYRIHRDRHTARWFVDGVWD